MKEIINKAAFWAQWIFVGTNFATIGTPYFKASIILWISSWIIWLLTRN